MPLTDKRCTPCKGGVPPLSLEQAESLAQQIPEWSLSVNGRRIKREFSFANFSDALGFVNRVGALAEEEDHHPEIRFGWGHAEIELWTHKIDGLHENDFILAAKIDRI